MTMSLISTVTVGAGGAASMDFTGIPQSGTDLLLVVSARTTFATTSADLNMRFNGSTTNYTQRAFGGDGGSAFSNSGSTTSIIVGASEGANATANTFSSHSIYIPNYTAAVNKSISNDSVFENNASRADQYMTSGRWSDTSAITSISIFQGANTLAQYSTASLYMITKGSGYATAS